MVGSAAFLGLDETEQFTRHLMEHWLKSKMCFSFETLIWLLII